MKQRDADELEKRHSSRVIGVVGQEWGIPTAGVARPRESPNRGSIAHGHTCAKKQRDADESEKSGAMTKGGWVNFCGKRPRHAWRNL